MLKVEKEIYMKVWNTRVSQNVRYATEDYLYVISSLCPKYPNIAHSLLRIAVRPLSYLDYWETPKMYSVIESIMKDDAEFMSWLKENIDLLQLCAKELAITYIFDELRYLPLLNQVQLNFIRDEEIAGINQYYNIITKNHHKINLKFLNFQEFRIYASTFFERLNISQEEIDLILFEENYEKVFELMAMN